MWMNRPPTTGMIALFALPVVLSAQTNAPQRQDTTPTFVNATGRSTVRAVPDRATVLLVVQSNAATPAEAASGLARLERAILDTLTRLGVPQGRVTAAAYGVGPARAAPGMPGGLPPGLAYSARTAIRLEAIPLNRLASFTAAALSQGAALVGQPRFESTAEDSLRAIAYREAVSDAERQATILAAGVRGRLGRLRDVTADEPARFGYDQWQQSYFPNDSPYDNQPKPPPEVQISVMVRARWELVTSPR